MRPETYDYIWKEIISDTIQSLYNEISDEEKIKSGLRVQDMSHMKDVIFLHYISENKRLKELYHFGMEDEKRIDIHKVAACFTKVLMEDKAFRYSLKDQVSDDVFLINAKLAYFVGIGLIRMNLIVAYLSMGNRNVVNKLLEKKVLEAPKTNFGHDEYDFGRQKTLMLNDVFENEFDILTYSDMLFWIEYYNRQVLEDCIHPADLPIISWDSPCLNMEGEILN